MEIIKLNNISFCYTDGTKALKEVDLSIRQGEKVAFLGHNGSGKTTLFLLIAGVLKNYTGDYFFKEKKMKPGDLKKMYKSTGIIFQDPDIQLLASTVFQEISFGPMNLGWQEDQIIRSVETAMENTGIAHLREKAPHLLSYGQKKGVAIADVLAMDPEVIILDEPLAWLDVKHKEKTIALLDDLSERGKTLILSSHNPDFAYQWADRIFVLKEGELLGDGSPEEIFTRRELIEEAALEAPLLFEISRKLNLKENLKTKEELFTKLEALWES